MNGGKVYGKWPGLKTERLYERADLAVTTDYRQVVCEALRANRADVNPKNIFPDYRFAAPLGLMRAAKARSLGSGV